MDADRVQSAQSLATSWSCSPDILHNCFRLTLRGTVTFALGKLSLDLGYRLPKLLEIQFMTRGVVYC